MQRKNEDVFLKLCITFQALVIGGEAHLDQGTTVGLQVHVGKIPLFEFSVESFYWS